MKSYNNTVIDNGIIDNTKVVMAVKDHSLDDGIINAAKEEFLEHGFQKASLHKIAANANVTTGALYTRYKNKNALFTALINPLFQSFQPYVKTITEKYYKAQNNKSVEDFLEAMKYESRIYFDIIFAYKIEATLLIYKSTGSEISENIQKMFIDNKENGTVKFFEDFAKEKSQREHNPKILEDFEIDKNVISMLMKNQFSLFNGLLGLNLEKEKALKCLESMEEFISLGWKNLFEKYM